MTNDKSLRILYHLLRPCTWPNRSLILLIHRRETLINKLLQSPSLIGLGCVDVALRIGSDAVNSKELARLPATVSKARQHLQRIALDYVHLLIATVSQINVFLLRIL